MSTGRNPAGLRSEYDPGEYTVEHRKLSPALIVILPDLLCIGIVQCNPSSDLTLADYLALADKWMYEQKKSCSVDD